MLVAGILIAFAVVFGSANQIDNLVDVGATVKEVENMLARDPRLPRLTRGEILKLIDEVRTGKEVVVVLPDNQAPNDGSSPLSSTTKRPVKRRRKKPVVRPVYVHTTTEDTSGSSTVRSAALDDAAVSSTQPPPPSGLDLSLATTSRPRVKTTKAPEIGLPPVPGLSLVEGINSWGPVKEEGSVYITPVPPASSTSTTRPPASSAAPANPEAPPNVKVAAESLGPEMKDLLTRFGLLGSETTTQRAYQAGPAPTIDPEVYSRFKPLPVKSTSEFVSPDMKSFLASYGLLDTRRGKDLKADSSEVKNSPLDYIPEREKDVLSQLGLWRDGKAIDVGVKNSAGAAISSSDAKNSAPEVKSVKHVFKPNKAEEASSQEELKKVSKILTKLKEIGEGKDDEMTALSPSDVEELLLLEDNTRLAAQEQVGLGEDQESLEEKNEVKRNPQGASASVSVDAGLGGSASASASAEASSGGNAQAAAAADVSDASTTTDSSASSDSSVSTTTEQPSSTDSLPSDSEDTTERGASAVDLADSFGGGGETTTKRPNGFYFLLDWNSFLDVGLDDPPGRAIHLNFSPKVGNPANFLPVTIGNSQSRRR
ncbi:hypothetical protein GE061_019343 [Apolygus lucorum]|uniref:Uncharacterized protein n=1 Tax=Apolygus lucorum TaxID=248454 RepID=A0A6A4JSP0_APOLU|nr:hypothetical protein GE061_019343 [Apolygus lucorum]